MADKSKPKGLSLQEQLDKLKKENDSLKASKSITPKADGIKVRANLNWRCEMGGINNRRKYVFKKADEDKPGFLELHTEDNPKGQIYVIPRKDDDGNKINDIEKLTHKTLKIVQIIA